MRRRALAHGTRFGLLLQLAVGPVCLFVLQAGSERGPAAGMAAVAGVALVDALYIVLAGLGVTRWAESHRARRALQYGGAGVIALFGLDLITSAARVSLLPSVGLSAASVGEAGVFLAAVLLTAANPLTIVFWAGVFAAKVTAERYGRTELGFFSLGCVLATRQPDASDRGRRVGACPCGGNVPWGPAAEPGGRRPPMIGAYDGG